jgi:hypothetical protein
VKPQLFCKSAPKLSTLFHLTCVDSLQHGKLSQKKEQTIALLTAKILNEESKNEMFQPQDLGGVRRSGPVIQARIFQAHFYWV